MTYHKKKMMNRNATRSYSLAETLRDTPCLKTLLLSLPFPIISPSLFNAHHPETT